MQIVILAGGLGTRLRAVSDRVAKPMVPVAGRPFLEWQVEALVSQGLRRVLLLVGHRAESIVEHFGDGARFGARITYSRERRLLGTGGALRLALPALEDRFLLLYGDSLLLDPLAPVAARLDEDPESGIMAVHRDTRGETGVTPNVALDLNGRVARYCKRATDAALDFIEAGAVFLRSTFVARLPERGRSELETDLYPQLALERRLRAWQTRHPFFDIGTPARLARAERFLRQRTGADEAEGEHPGWT